MLPQCFFFENQSSVKVCNRPKLSVTTMVLSIHNHRSFHENRIWLRSDRWREDLQYLSHYVCSTTEYCQEKVSLLFTVLLKGTIKNIQQHFVILHTHTQQYRYLFQKNLTALHCKTVISSRYIREPRMLSSIRSQSKKKIALKTSLQSAASLD